jgi:phosphatidylserine decarboxylase
VNLVGWLLIGALAAVATASAVAWKWQLNLSRATATACLLAAFVAIAIGIIVSSTSQPGFLGAPAVWIGTLALGIVTVLVRFYRDPERTSPEGDDLVVSPADGTVLYVKESIGGVIPAAEKKGREYRLDELTKTQLRRSDAVILGIGLSMLDVHVNRAPISGRVRLQNRFPGRFGSLRRPEMVFENERATIVVERDSLEVAVVLIASRLVRRIVTFVDVGESIARGQRIGVIRFGSQVDLVLPSSGVDVLVKPGERVVAGETVLATLTSQEAAALRPGDAARSVDGGHSAPRDGMPGRLAEKALEEESLGD